MKQRNPCGKDWRATLYHNQKKLQSNPSADVSLAVSWLTPFILKPGATSTAFTLLLLSSAVLSAHAEINQRPREAGPKLRQHGQSEKGQIQLAAERKLQLSPLSPKGCQRIPDLIQHAAQLLPDAQEKFKRVLDNPYFSIKCPYPADAPVTDTTAGSFSVSEHAMYFSEKTLNMPAVVNHEFTHADVFFSHQTRYCPATTVDEALSPLFPAHAKNIRRYQNALDKGDARVREFKALWFQSYDEKQTLTAQERATLHAYIKASEKCLKTIQDEVRPVELYDQFVKAGYGSAKPMFITCPLDFKHQVLYAEQKNGLTHYQIEAVEPLYSVFYIIDTVPLMLRVHHSEQSTLHQLAERDAYTFQSLSQDAIDTFYPEAYALRQQDLKHCYGERAESEQLGHQCSSSFT